MDEPDPSGGFDPHRDDPEWAAVVGRGPFSPGYHAASELIGRRWTGAIIRAMFHGASTFREIAIAIPGLSDRLLSERLKELRRHGVVTTRDFADRGYVLTEKGLALRRIVIEIARWAHAWDVAAEGPLSDGE